MRVVLDTNVIVSALSHGGKPLKILSIARKGEIQLVISPFRTPTQFLELLKQKGVQ